MTQCCTKFMCHIHRDDKAGSCTRPLRIIILPPTPGTMPPTQPVLEGGKAMVSHLFYYQLAVLALVWLFVMLHVTEAKPSLHRVRASCKGLPVLCVSERPCIPPPLLRYRPIPCPQRADAPGRWPPRG